MKKQIAIELICLLFIVLLIYAATSKLMDYQKFTVQIGQSPMLTGMAGFIAWFIPIVEIVLSIMLGIQRTRLLGLYGSFSIMIVFTSYIVAITQFSEYVPCSCGGVLQNLGWTEHLIINIGFSLLAVTAILVYDKLEQSQRGQEEQKPKAALSS